jgi:Arc/MetJ-type ribon-helix-helix transcriptional regulator
MKPILFEVDESWAEEIDAYVEESSEYSSRSQLIRRAIAAEMNEDTSRGIVADIDDTRILQEIEITQVEMAYLVEMMEDTPTYTDYDRMLKRVMRQTIRILREDLDPDDIWEAE